MKLLTLNTHSLIEPEYEAKREIFVEFIAKEQPDVFALQEVNQTAAAPELKAVPAGYNVLSGQHRAAESRQPCGSRGPDVRTEGRLLPLELAPGQDRL